MTKKANEKANEKKDESRLSPLASMMAYLALLFVLVAILARPLVPDEDYGFGQDLLFHTLVLTALVWWFLLFLLDHHVVLVRARIEGPLVFFLAFLVASPFVAGDRYRAIERVSAWAADIALFYLVFNLAVHARVRRLLFRAAIGAALAVSLYAIDQAHGGLEETRKFAKEDPSVSKIATSVGADASAMFEERLASDRPFSTLVLATLLGGYLVLFLLPLAGQVLDRFLSRESGGGPAPLVADVVVLGLVGYALFLTKSRGAILAAGFGLAVFAVLSWREIRSHRRLAATLATLAVLIVALLGTAWSSGWFGEDPMADAQRSFRYRLGYWRGAIDVIREHIWTGVGADNLRHHYFRVKPDWAPEAKHTHNNYLQVAAELGLAGLAVFLAVWASVFRAMARAPREGPIEDRPLPPAPNHFAPLPLGAAAVWLLTIGAGIGALVVLSAIGDYFRGPVIPGGLAAVFLALAGLYIVVDTYRPESARVSDIFRRRGFAAALAAALFHWFVNFDLYSAQTSQATWIVAALALVSFRRPDATGDVVFRRIGLVAPPPAGTPGKSATAAHSRPGESSYLLRLGAALLAILIPWALFIFAILVPQFQASVYYEWGNAALLGLDDAEAEAGTDLSLPSGATLDPGAVRDARAEGSREERERDRLLRASDYFEKCLEFVPGHLEARFALGRTVHRRWSKDLKTAIDVEKPAQVRAFEKARRSYEDVLERTPYRSSVHLALHDLYWQRGKIQVERPAGSTEGDSPADAIRARVAAGWGDLTTALGHLEASLDAYPTEARGHFHAAGVYGELARLHAIAAGLVPDISAPPENPGERAIRSLERALELSDRAIEIHDRLRAEEVLGTWRVLFNLYWQRGRSKIEGGQDAGRSDLEHALGFLERLLDHASAGARTSYLAGDAFAELADLDRRARALEPDLAPLDFDPAKRARDQFARARQLSLEPGRAPELTEEELERLAQYLARPEGG